MFPSGNRDCEAAASLNPCSQLLSYELILGLAVAHLACVAVVYAGKGPDMTTIINVGGGVGPVVGVPVRAHVSSAFTMWPHVRKHKESHCSLS